MKTPVSENTLFIEWNRFLFREPKKKRRKKSDFSFINQAINCFNHGGSILRLTSKINLILNIRFVWTRLIGFCFCSVCYCLHTSTDVCPPFMYVRANSNGNEWINLKKKNCLLNSVSFLGRGRKFKWNVIKRKWKWKIVFRNVCRRRKVEQFFFFDFCLAKII